MCCSSRAAKKCLLAWIALCGLLGGCFAFGVDVSTDPRLPVPEDDAAQLVPDEEAGWPEDTADAEGDRARPDASDGAVVRQDAGRDAGDEGSLDAEVAAEADAASMDARTATDAAGDASPDAADSLDGSASRDGSTARDAEAASHDAAATDASDGSAGDAAVDSPDAGGSQLCAVGSCNLSCDDSLPSCMCTGVLGCDVGCAAGASCDLSCYGVHSCRPTCAEDSRCNVTCSGTTRCKTTCAAGSTCNISCTATDCSGVTCAEGADCLLNCGAYATCSFASCPDGQLSCPGNITVCGRGCP